MAKPPVVLFADRDLSWSRDARVRLRRRGAEVHMASTVDDALRVAADHTPDLLILDDDLDGRGTLTWRTFSAKHCRRRKSFCWNPRRRSRAAVARGCFSPVRSP